MPLKYPRASSLSGSLSTCWWNTFSPPQWYTMPPPLTLLEAMGNYNEELVNAGILLAGEGLQPSAAGKRVAFDGSHRTVIDGPFEQTSELVAGFWLWEVKDLGETVEWAKRCPNPMSGPSEIEIRPLFEASDFGEAMTPELREQEDRLMEELEGH